MRNVTVKELIELLKHMDQEAVVCHMEMDNDHPIFSTFEIIRYYPGAFYINDQGDDLLGNVVAIY